MRNEIMAINLPRDEEIAENRQYFLRHAFYLCSVAKKKAWLPHRYLLNLSQKPTTPEG